MARARNIKPGFFKNEDLAECTPWARLCFAGLWTLADREGRLEDRAKRIKGELFPYDAVEVGPLLEELAQWGFIKRYTVDGERYIVIVKFVEHQTPHGTERDGTVPDENGFVTVHQRGKNGYITGNYRLEAHSKTVKQSDPTPPDNATLTVKRGSPEGGENTLIPDSLIPDSLNTPLTPQGGKRRKRLAAEEMTPGFLRFWDEWPKHHRKEAKGKCFEVWAKEDFEDLAEAIIGHVKRKKLSTEWTKDGGQFIPAPKVYLNQRRWEGAEGPSSAPIVVDGDGREWWTVAGFDSLAHAQNERCHIGNFREFRDGRRVQGATA